MDKFKNIINPNKELFKWGPIDAMPIYPDIWYGALVKFAKRFVSWPSFLMWVHDEKIMFICEYQPLRDTGEENFKKFILVDKEFKKNYDEWQGILKELTEHINKNSKEKIAKAGNKQFNKIFDAFAGIYHRFWIIGLLPELSNWGGEQMLRSLLRKELNKNRIDEKKKNTEDEKEFQAVVEKLSAPEDYSFYQEEELDLLKIKKFEANKNLSEKMIDVHQQKFFWLLNSYHHTQVLSTEHFKKELSALPLKEAEKKLKAIEDMKTNVLNRKKELVKKYNLSSNVEKIAHRLAFCIWWQDQRKKFIFITNAYIDALLMEMSKRFNINFDSLHYYCIEEINKLIKENKPLAEKEISLRKLYFMRNYYAGDNKSKVFCGKDVENIIKPYTEIKIYPNLKEFKGTVVSIGNKSKVKGIVKVVKSGKEIGKVNKGDVLVAPMTAPDYVVGMKKASAIITDEGGITCHAAIVSRELGIPCIVGTGIASKILKDGDVIEVNANHGIVRKIKQE